MMSGLHSADDPIVVLRHGQTAGTEAGAYAGRTDHSLSAAGRSELLSDGVPVTFPPDSFDLIVSPLRRAIETADLLFPAVTRSVIAPLAEWNYGDLEGLTRAEIERDLGRWDIWVEGCPGGERLVDVVERVRPVARRLSERTRPAVVVAHGHVLRVLTPIVLGVDPMLGKHLTLDPAHGAIIEPSHDALRISGWNLPARNLCERFLGLLS